MKQYPEAIRNKALELYITDNTMVAISKLEGMPNRATLKVWKDRYEWDKKKEQASQLAGERVGMNLAEIKERQLRISRDTQGDYTKTLKAKPGKTTYKDADSAMKHELLLAGEATDRTEADTEITVRWMTKKEINKKLGIST